MPYAAIIGVSVVKTSQITGNLFPSSKLTLGGLEVALNGASGNTHPGVEETHKKGKWSVEAVSKLTVGGSTVAVEGNLATCLDVVVNDLPNKLSIL